MPQRSSKGPRNHAVEAAAVADWYAVADDGDSALRIAPGLTLGEHPDGALALNARAPAARWVTIEVREGEAFLRALASWRLVGEGGGMLERMPLSDGLCVALPHNLLRVSHSIRAPAATGPSISVEPVESAPATAPAAAPAPGPDPAAVPERGRQSAPEPKAVVRGPPVTAAGADPRGKPATGLRPAVALALGVAVVSVTLGAWWWLAPGRAAPTQAAGQPVEPSVSAPAQTPPARPEPATWSIAEIRLAPVPLRLLPPPGHPAAEPDASVPAGQARAGSAAAASPGPTPADPRLETARQYFDAGQITYPPGENAVALALTVLRDHPGHPGAMELLGRCTTYLLNEARAQRAAGRDYEARNTLEEVLGFNPDHPEARQLWADWVETRR